MISKIMPMRMSAPVQKKISKEASLLSADKFLSFKGYDDENEAYWDAMEENKNAKPVLMPDGNWYRPHQPVDASDYFHYEPCKPPQQPNYSSSYDD